MSEMLLPHEADFTDEDFGLIEALLTAYKERVESVLFKIRHLRREEEDD